MIQRLLILLAFVLSAFLVGCGSKDVDPGAPVKADGYYNGPMKPRGGNAPPAGGAGGEAGATAGQ